MLTPDQQQTLADATPLVRLSQSDAYPALKAVLVAFEEDALQELRDYDGHDKEELFNLVRRWHARCDLRAFVELEISRANTRIEQVREELNISPDELMIRREIAHG